MKTGEIEYWLEIPIKIKYEVHPAEKQTLTYPGCPAHIEIEDMVIPSKEEIAKLLDNASDESRIESAIWEDWAERDYP